LFWGEAIQKVKEKNQDFLFIAEAYWMKEGQLQRLGFDYTYDKRLYDRLKEGDAKPVRQHLNADLDYQRKMARFLENHDELRAASEFTGEKHEAAAIITYFSSGLRFFHQGQLQGKEKRISPHLGRGPSEAVNKKLENFYEKLLSVLHEQIFKAGNWKLLECFPAWEGNSSHDNYICFAWETAVGNKKMLVVVNYSPGKSQCYVKLPFNGLNNKTWQLIDLFSGVVYDREGEELQSRGFYLDEPGWKYYVFMIKEK
jgi:hypothetical protein